MTYDLVSILVPVYNVEKYLKDCLISIVNQTYKNIEVILVNDGSTDSSLEICKQFLFDDRIVLIDKKNEGLSIARQVAIDRAEGKFLCIIDSDDFVEKDFVEKLYTNISSSGSDIAICASRFFSESFSKVYGLSNSVSSYKEISKYDIENNYANLLVQYNMSDSWAKIYKLSFVRQSNIRFTLSSDFNGTDLLFNHLLMFYMPKISILYDVLYNHRIHANSRVHRKGKKMQEGFQIIMTAILQESEKFNLSVCVNNQFSIVYLRFALEAAQDIVNTVTSFKNLKIMLRQFHKHNKIYIMKDEKLTFRTAVHNRIPGKIFSILLKYESIFVTYIYLKLREFRLCRP